MLRIIKFIHFLENFYEINNKFCFENLGTIGHVAHGKSTVVKAISGVHTVRFKNELERNITIKLGYANAKVCHYCTSNQIISFYLNHPVLSKLN